MILSLTRKLSGVVQEMAEKATQALTAMEKRAVMAESMLEATLNSESGLGNTHSARRGLDTLKGNITKSITRSHSSPSSKYFSFLPLKGQLQFVAASRKDGC
jgi:hypothetical protein